MNTPTRNALTNMVKKSQHTCVHVCEAPCCVSVEPEHSWFITKLIPQPGVQLLSFQHAARSPRHEPKQLGGVWVCVKGGCDAKTLCYYSLSKSAQWGEGSGVSGSQRGVRRKSMGEGKPFRNMNGLRRERDGSGEK